MQAQQHQMKTSIMATAANAPGLLQQVGMAGGAAVITVSFIHPIDVIKVSVHVFDGCATLAIFLIGFRILCEIPYSVRVCTDLCFFDGIFACPSIAAEWCFWDDRYFELNLPTRIKIDEIGNTATPPVSRAATP